MLKTIALGILTLAISFFVGTSYINAQEATPIPTEMEEEVEGENDTPTAAPQTGFGN